jgi:hypothetical protein
MSKSKRIRPFTERIPIEIRFWKKVDKKSDDECWEWVGAKNKQGYGKIGYFGGFIATHRYSWLLHNGSIPDGLWVLHTCDNPPCCNPKHLFLGNHQDNMDDRQRKGRQPHTCHIGSKNPHAKLNEQKVRTLREMYASGKYTQLELSNIFGIAWKYVSEITRNNFWKNV